MATNTKLNELVLMQKKAVRVICNEPYRAHTAPLFQAMNILQLKDLITYSKIKFMYRFFKNKQPPSFDTTWQTNYQINPNLALRNAYDFAIPPHRIELYRRSPLVTFASTWNECRVDKSIRSEKSFLKKVRESLTRGNVN